MRNHPDEWQAFPTPDGENGGCNYGMTLRDYFAAKTLLGMVSRKDFMNDFCEPPSSREEARKEVASLAYKMADAMMIEREKV
jgi:hypothetical protein